MYEIDKFEWCSHKRGNRVEGRRCPEKCPWKKTPPPQEIASRRITIRKYGTQQSFPLEIYPASTFAKILLMKIAPRKNTPQKNCFSSFFSSFAVDIFKLCIVTSFRGVSSTSAAYVTDLCVTLINGMN